jgi:hypothetical protein
MAPPKLVALMFRARAGRSVVLTKPEILGHHMYFCVGARAAITAPVRGTEGGIALYSQGRRAITLPRRQFLHRQQVQSRCRPCRGALELDYQLVKGAAKPENSRNPGNRKSRTLSNCGFLTIPPHDRRSHRNQKKKAAFSTAQLRENGLVKV